MELLSKTPPGYIECSLIFPLDKSRETTKMLIYYLYAPTKKETIKLNRMLIILVFIVKVLSRIHCVKRRRQTINYTINSHRN